MRVFCKYYLKKLLLQVRIKKDLSFVAVSYTHLLLHAKLGACFANELYGVTDPEILSAIIWHTTGCPEMSLLDKIVFIADYMEANRNQAEDLPEAVSYTHLGSFL